MQMPSNREEAANLCAPPDANRTGVRPSPVNSLGEGLAKTLYYWPCRIRRS